MPKARKKLIGSPQGQNWILGTTPMSRQGGGGRERGQKNNTIVSHSTESKGNCLVSYNDKCMHGGLFVCREKPG